MVAAKNGRKYSIGSERRCTGTSSVNTRQTTSSASGIHMEVSEAKEVNNNNVEK